MNRNLSLLTLVLALIAVGMAVSAWSLANRAKQIALSEIELEERDALLTPVFDEETSSGSYLAIFEWALSHSSGPAIRLESLVPVEEQDGYLVTLYDGAPTGSDLQERVFRTESTLQEIQLHPEKIKTLGQTVLADRESLDLQLESGKTRFLRVGVRLHPYGEKQNLLADVVLLSFKLCFDNGKTRIIRRGIPIQALTHLPQ